MSFFVFFISRSLFQFFFVRFRSLVFLSGTNEPSHFVDNGVVMGRQ